MPYQTTSAGDVQRQGRFMAAAGATSGRSGLFKSQTINAAGTRSTRNFWISSEGRLRWVSGAEPTNELTGGTDVTASLPAGTVTPIMSSAAMQEMPIPINPFPEGAQAAGVDVSARLVYRTTATNSMNAGVCFAHFHRAVRINSGQTVSLGLGTTAANNLFGRSFTASQSAGTITSLTAGSVTSISTSTNVRFDSNLSASVSLLAGSVTLTWIPQKRGSN